MATSEVVQQNVYLDDSLIASDWERQEGSRLSSMGELVDVLAEVDLTPVVSEAREARIDSTKDIELIDIGAGPSPGIENLCSRLGVVYYGFDGKQEWLDARATDPSRLILGRSEDMSMISDGQFDIAFSRAATAWSSAPDSSIAEQLRIADRSVFTEYDWTHASVSSDDRDVSAAGLAAKATLMMVLEGAGFDTTLGATMGERIDAVAQAAGLTHQRSETRHELPLGDHRAVFLDAANTILAQLSSASENGADAVSAARATTAALFLKKYLRIIEAAPADTLSIRLPALVTQRVEVTGR